MQAEACAMTERLTSTNIVEGSSETKEAKEPRNPLKTTSVPALKTNWKASPAAETGLVSVVMAQAEGKDIAEDQDASRTTAESQVIPVPQKAAESISSRAPAVLIIEDTTELAEVIQATLERMNITTAHETHGGKAIARFNELMPDVVLLDIGLPDMTGWKFLEAVKETHKGALPVIIVITAYGDPANRLIGKLQSVHDYLIKPFTSDEVERVVTSALASRTQ
jgi:CheY-like chemotaxis protein